MATLTWSSTSSDSPNASTDASSRNDCFPKISFTKPTDTEANQIKRLLYEQPKATDQDSRSDGLKSLFVHKSAPESITDESRISVPDLQSSRAATGNDYVSFGDQGTTVTVNAYGSIMQITRSLGYGHSGLFCVDTTDVCIPILPQSRLEKLMQMSKNPEQGIRLKHLTTFGERADFTQQKPKLEFIFNRWPRFISQPVAHTSDASAMKTPSADGDAKDPPVSLQYFCHKGTVFQRYTFDHDPEAPSGLQNALLGIRRNFLIRSLDFVNDSTFNRADPEDDDYVSLSGTKKRGHVFVHRISPTNAMELGIEEEKYWQKGGPKGIALVISVFVNGKAQVVDPFFSHLFVELSQETRDKLQSRGQVDITVAYRLQVLRNNQSWKKSFIPASALDAMTSCFSESSGVPFQKIRWSPNDHVNFITGRNLEHILSVCSMPVPTYYAAAKNADVPEDGDGTKGEHDGKEKDAAKGVDGRNHEDDMDTTSLAFTCGDMSGHSISSAASFFAFEFLVDILKTLCERSKEVDEAKSNLPRSVEKMGRFKDDKQRDDYITEIHAKEQALCNLSAYMSELRVRITNTLEAHMKWTSKAEKNAGFVVAKYWITGKEIGDWRNHTSFPPASLMDVPFEIIKTHSLYELYEANKDLLKRVGDDGESHTEIQREFDNREVLNEHLQSYVRPWLQRLYEGDKRHQYVFPREQMDGDKRKKYRLADHVWICRAVKCVEELGLEEHLELEGGKEYLEYPSSEGKRNRNQTKRQGSKGQERSNRSTELQRVILKRFTTRNPQSQQRMLATSRTPLESRFLFHAKDTALFYAMDKGFFDREKKTNHKRTNWINKITMWKETVEAQTEHEETQTLDWEKPLWYALAFVVSSTRRRINKASADQMLHITAKILFGLSSTSGLFPGRLNEKREAIVFEDDLERDKYWHTTFEIPYALWKYGREYLEISPEHDESDRVRGLQQDMIQAKNYGQLQQPMTKRMEFSTFNGLIDKSRIVEVSDDWLREAPSSLNLDSSTSFNDLWFYEEMQKEGRDYGRIINKALKNRNDDLPELQEAPGTGVVFDVPKNNSSRLDDKSGMESRTQLQTNVEIKEVLEVERTTQIAKKRLVWLPRADKETALTCWLASSTRTEQDNLSAFFDKHASYEKHFYDGTSAVWNEWVTELHLSYFRKAKWNDTKEEDQKRKKDTIPDLSFITVNARVADVGKMTESTKIVRSTMSFRFVGDFFDRYWTCHFLEFDPAGNQSKPKDTLKSRLSDLGFEKNDEEGHLKGKKPWQQRKVLELLLFDYILGEIHSSTKGLLEWIQDVVVEKDNILTVNGIDTVSILEIPFGVRATKPLNPLAEALQAGVQSSVETGSDGYFSIVERWRFFEQVLQAIEEDLSRNLETISFWNNREQDREPERPRWTRNDEISYRQVINKLQVMNHRKIRDLESLCTAIRTFRASLTGKLDTMRSDLEYQDSESINLFTYVTVVFLPLGFATGIFSMSGPPDLSTLVNMIELSLIAMAITLFALSNAKTTGRTIVHPIILTFQYINNCLLDPLLRPFCWLGNILLHLGIILEFRLLKWFFQFMVYPIIDWLNQGAKSLIPNWNPKSVREKYQNLVHSNRQVIAKRRDRNPGKAAREDIKSQRVSKKKGDEEFGGSQSDFCELKDV